MLSDPIRDDIDTDAILNKAEVYDRLRHYQNIQKLEMAE